MHQRPNTRIGQGAKLHLNDSVHQTFTNRLFIEELILRCLFSSSFAKPVTEHHMCRVGIHGNKVVEGTAPEEEEFV